MADYLAIRRSLSGVVLMVDSRLGFTDLDRQLLAWVAPRVGSGEVKLLVLLTKSDKLKKGPAKSTLLKVRAKLAEHGDLVSVQLFSALKHTGHPELIAVLDAWLTDVSVYDDDLEEEAIQGQ